PWFLTARMVLLCEFCGAIRQFRSTGGNRSRRGTWSFHFSPRVPERGSNSMAKAPPPKAKQAAVVVKEVAAVEPAADLNRGGMNGAPQPTGAKNRQAAAIKETEVLGAVAGLNLDGVSGNIASTQAEVQKSLGDLSAKLLEQLQVLRNIEEAIAL